MNLPDMKMDDQIRELLVLCLDQGWRLEAAATANKIKCYPPDKSLPCTTIPSRGMGRSYQNVATQLRRSGLVIPGKDPVIGLTKEPVVSTTYRDILEDPNVLGQLSKPELDKIMKIVDKDSPEGQIGNLLGLFNEAIDSAAYRLSVDVARVLLDNTRNDSLETQVLELLTERDGLTAQVDRLTAQVSQLGNDLKDCAQKSAEQTERANHAENKLRALRSALKDD